MTDESVSWREACGKIGAAPALRDEAARMLPQVEAEAKPAPRDALIKLLIAKRVVFGIPDMEAGEWSEVWNAYTEALADMPLSAVEIGFQRWNKGECYPKEVGRHAFYPKPAEIYKLGEPHMAKLRIAAYRARRALEQHEQSNGVWTEERRAEERRKAIEAGIMSPDGKLNVPLRRFEEPKKMSHEDVMALRHAAALAPVTPPAKPDEPEEIF